MESLALLVSLLALGQLLFGILVIVFAAIYRRKGKFRLTSIVLISALALVTAWALNAVVAFGIPPLVALAIAALVRFLPRRASQS